MVHQYQLNGYNIVLDTCSGSVHVVDEVAYDVIAMYPDHTADEIVAAMMAKYGDREDVTEADLRQCIDDVASLKESGKLWSPDTYENLAFDFKNRNTVVKALCLHVAHTCNLNCSYCFASQGRYQGERALMSFEVGKRAMDFLIENSGSRRNLEVDFFGGEPGQTVETLYEDLQFIKELEPHMVGIGPFISQKDTPFVNEKSGTMDETLRLLSIIRLIHPKVLLPATTALGTIHPLGREKGIQSGANVVMPNLSPVNVRDKYKLYDNKICTGDEAAECRFCMENRMKSIGYQVVVSRGDYADM